MHIYALGFRKPSTLGARIRFPSHAKPQQVLQLTKPIYPELNLNPKHFPPMPNRNWLECVLYIIECVLYG